jgi:hypothetical protein
MAKVIPGNHAAVFVPLQDRDKIRQFYRDVLGGKITSEEDQKDLFRIGDNFYLAFLYRDYADENKFLRSGRSIWLEVKSDNVEEMSRKILESGLNREARYTGPPPLVPSTRGTVLAARRNQRGPLPI